MAAAAVRAIEQTARTARLARRVSDELDEVTDTHGVPTADLADTDSAVMVVEEALVAVAKIAKPA